MSSEDPEYAIESVFSLNGDTAGWRAATVGPQTIRIVFDVPQHISLIHIRFEESAVVRTQEFVLTWSASGEQAPQEIVRQQWNFSPGGSHTEIENYKVDLNNVNVLQLTINPDIDSARIRASLTRLRIARCG